MNYGAVMKKSLSYVLLLTVSIPALFYAEVVNSQEATDKAGIYELDDAQAKMKLEQNTKVDSTTVPTVSKEESQQPKIIKEQTARGYIEKLMSPDGKVIAEKTIEDGEVVKKVLNYYHPNGYLSRQITAQEDNNGFYAEDYYPNGKIAAQATYLNETNKIGVEKKYDNNGVLRQEIPWAKVQDKDQEKIQQTERRGRVLTYYPNGKFAASIPVGKKGKAIFYNQQGRIIKEIENAKILNFAPELNAENCKDKVVKLSLNELVELYEDEGDISYNKCGLPYRENFVYEISDIKGNQIIKVSYDESGMIRKITPYKEGLKNGVEQKFDGSGNLTAEINYKQGIKDGMANGYFPSKDVAFRKMYKDGKVSGTLTCYFPTGEVAAEFPYKNGLKEGKAKIYGPNGRELVFKQDKIEGEQPNENTRIINASKLSELKQQDARCLDFSDKKQEMELDIAANINTIKQGLSIEIPDSCVDFSSFKPEKSNYVCYDALDRLRAIFPTGYNRGEYAVETVYNEKGQHIYDIPYYKKQRQGIAQKFNEKGEILAEVYYNQDKQAESSRSYYPNGAVKEMITIADSQPRTVMVRYTEDGELAFSVNYNKEKMTEAFIAEPNKNKDIFIRFYENNIDYIREVNATNPFNYIEYNLALGEYLVYRDNELIKGGKICGYEKEASVNQQDNPIVKEIKQEPKLPEKVEINNEVKIENNKEEKVSQTENELPSEEQELISSVPQEKAEVAKSEEKQNITNNNVMITQDKPVAEVKTVIAPEKSVSAANEASKAEVKIQPKVENKEQLNVKTDVPVKAEKTMATSPILPEEAAPMVEDLEPITLEDIKIKNAIIPSPKEKKENELAAKNIGPIAKPDIEDLTDVVSKEHVSQIKQQEETKGKEESNTEKFYYPNGNLRKSIKTKGGRTEEIKEYSKTGLLITDTTYEKDGILIEKYYGSGEIRRKTHKNYDDNSVMAFVSREDFYDNGKPRYEIKRKPDSLLFMDKQYTPEGVVKIEQEQKSPLVFVIKEYDSEGKLLKEREQQGVAQIEKEYDKDGKIKTLRINKAEMPVSLSKNSSDIIKDSLKAYDKKGGISSEFKSDGKSDSIVENYKNGKIKTEIKFYNNGEISVKSYSKDGSLEKFAYLAPSGKLHMQKPSVRTVPSYRERYWVDYNNPRWIENQDKYNIQSIGRLNIDTAAYILAELGIEVPEMLKKMYEIYK